MANNRKKHEISKMLVNLLEYCRCFFAYFSWMFDSFTPRYEEHLFPFKVNAVTND